MAGPLHGLCVIEMAGIGPCPLAGQLLADLGADVVVIDRASGDADPTDINRRGKRSVALNLKADEGRKIARDLINTAGIMIEGFRPGVMERLGLGPDDLGDHVILGRMTGWGQTGPLAQTAGHDINYLSITGALGAMGNPGEASPPPLNLIGDYGGGTMFLIFGLFSAMFERDRSGKGQVVDVAMSDGVTAMMGLIHTGYARQDWGLDRASNLLDGGAPFYRTYKTADDRRVSVGPLEPQFFAELIDGMGLPEAERLTQMDRASWPEKHRLYEAIFARKTRAEWEEVFAGSDACVAPVLKFDEVLENPHNKARNTYVAPGGVLQSAPAPRFSRSGENAVSAPTGPGAQTDEILQKLGFDADAIAGLRADKVLT
ncbi:MAG: CaiB/BaiF CoA-transferase family protein [Pseudomonadota bacterium]